jgi:tRNA 2-selenouridine synthase
MRGSECLNVIASLDARVDFLLKDYAYFLTQPDFLIQRLNALRSLQSRETLSRWSQFIHTREWPSLVRELLELHYDPLYRSSQNRHFSGMQDSPDFTTNDLSPAGITQLAAAIVQSRRAQIA